MYSVSHHSMLCFHKTRLPTSYLRTYTVITWLLKSRSSRRGYEEICFYLTCMNFWIKNTKFFSYICELLVYLHMHIFVLWAQQTIFIRTEWEGIQGVINYIPTTSSHKNPSRKTNMIWYTFFVKEILLIILHIRYTFNKKSFYYNIIT